VVLFSAYQGWGRATPPLLVGLLRVSVLLLGGWYLFQQQNPRLEWLYALIAGSTVLGAVVLGSAFVFRSPVRTARPV
jgi:Na+-driven multidrug efflux pump